MDMELGKRIDLLYEIRRQRLDAERVVKGLQEEETILRESIIREMPKDTTGISGHIARVTRTEKHIPTVKNWDRFLPYVAENGYWEMVQRRVNPAAIKEHMEAGEEVPGVEMFTKIDLSIGKA